MRRASLSKAKSAYEKNEETVFALHVTPTITSFGLEAIATGSRGVGFAIVIDQPAKGEHFCVTGCAFPV